MDDLVDRLLNWKDQTVVMDVPQTADDVQKLLTEAAERIEDLTVRAVFAEAYMRSEDNALAARLAAMQQSMDEVRPFTEKLTARLARMETALCLIANADGMAVDREHRQIAREALATTDSAALQETENHG